MDGTGRGEGGVCSLVSGGR